MSWSDRLQPEIVLTSPNGATFNAKWRGDSRDLEKKIGIFEYPGFNGAVIQDLDARATRWPLTFFFEGDDHDVTAGQFFTACKENGSWWVDHPVLGALDLYLLYVQQDVQPIDSANVTVIKTEWIEPVDGFIGRSSTERQAEVVQRVFKLQEAAAGQFAAVAKPSKLAQFRNAVTKVQSAVYNTLRPLTRTVAEVNAAIESIHRGITTTIADTGLSLLALGGQLQALTTLPAMTGESAEVRLEYYATLVADMVGVGSDSNALATRELIATSSLSAAATVAAGADLTTREQAIEQMAAINTLFATLTADLDAGQAAYSGVRLDDRYFSQSTSFVEASLLVAAVNDLLLRRLFDLSAARHIVLQRNRTPVEIAITEGVDLDLFISSNHLSGNDVLLLPSGREVVVYL